MNRLSMLVLITGSAMIFNSCRKVVGEGPVLTENRTRENFTAIAMRLSGNVYYKQDSVYRVEIRAQQNILDVIESPVINNELVLRFKNNVFVGRRDEVIINISAPSVNSFSVSGSGNLHSTGDITPANCSLDISGSGNIFLHNIITDNIDAVISGSGDIQVAAGSANYQTLRISGSGSIDMLNLLAKSATTTTSGSGTMKVNLSERLDTKISGSGNVYYKGTPAVSVKISGSGKVVSL